MIAVRYQNRVVWRELMFTILALMWTATSCQASDLVHGGKMVLEPPNLYELVHYPARKSHSDRPAIALALSGGGARGLAQIGVLRALEEAQLPIVGIAGASMGAIIGGLCAAGYSAAQLDSIVKAVDWVSLFSDAPSRTQLLLSQKDNRPRSFLTIHFHGLKPNLPSAMTGGQRLVRVLTELFHAPDYHCRSDFDSLPIPFRAVATDLVSGQRVVLGRGDLVMGLRGASAFPLALSPAAVDSLLLVDGGLTDPIPVDVAQDFGADLVLAVNTTSGLQPQAELRDVYSVANQSTTIMTAPQLARSLAAADAVIVPDLAGISNFDFRLIDTLIARGYAAARVVLDSLSAAWAARPDSISSQEKTRIDSIVVTGLPDRRPELAAAAEYAREADAPFHTVGRLQKKLEEIAEGGFLRRITAQLRKGSRTTVAEITFEPNPVLTAVEITGNTVFPDSVLQRHFVGLVGRPANLNEIASAARCCLEEYGAQSRSLAEIRGIALDTLTGRLTVDLDEGRLAGLQVIGNTTVKTWVITRHFPLKPGQLFSFPAVLQGMEDLHASGLFSQINARITRTDAGPLVVLEVVEKDYDIVRLGLHHDLEYQTETFVEIVNTNILGLGNEMYIHAGYCPRREQFAAGLRADRVFRTLLTAEIRADREIHQRHRYTDNRRDGFFETARNGLLFSLGQNIKRLGTLSCALRSEDIKLTQPPPTATSTARLRSVILDGRYDDLDRLPFPRRGRHIDLSVEWADNFAGGQVVFRKISGHMENWVPFSETLTLGQQFTVGSADHSLPLFERYALGGRRNLFGLHDDEFLGDRILLGNFDFRFRFSQRCYLNLRIDAGTVWGWRQRIDLPGDLRLGVGGGPSFDTPLGPLELYWGKSEGRYSNFYFNWGYDF